MLLSTSSRDGVKSKLFMVWPLTAVITPGSWVLCWSRTPSWMPWRWASDVWDNTHDREERHERPCVQPVSLHHVVLLWLWHYMKCLSVYSITVAPARCRSCRPLLCLSWCPMHVCMFLGGPLEVARPLSGCWLSSSLLVCSTIGVLGLCISCWGLFLCFTLFYHVAGQNSSVNDA